jgi:hypothetical protein
MPGRGEGMMEHHSRETLQLFDLMFKWTLKEASPRALTHFINGLFEKNYPPDSAVMFNATESVGADNEKLKKITSDMIVTVAGDAFLIEAQISDDETIALRVFQYAFAHAAQNKEISESGEVVALIMPDARILYWETGRKTPDKVTLRLIFPDKTTHDYEIETFKVLNHRVETLGKRNMALLFPFCLLKFRKEMKKAGASPEMRRQIAGDMKELLRKLEKMIDAGCETGVLSGGDAAMILERIAQMHEELYRNYSEFEEAKMELQERLKTHWKEYLQKGREDGLQKGRIEGQNRILSLLKQGYTVEQLEELLSKEVSQSRPQTQ